MLCNNNISVSLSKLIAEEADGTPLVIDVAVGEINNDKQE